MRKGKPNVRDLIRQDIGAALAFSAIERLLCDVVLTDNIRRPFTSGVFLEKLNDLFFSLSLLLVNHFTFSIVAYRD